LTKDEMFKLADEILFGSEPRDATLPQVYSSSIGGGGGGGGKEKQVLSYCREVLFLSLI